MADCSSFGRSERLERLCCSICCAVICASTAVFALTIVLSSSESESLPYVTSATLELGDQHRDLVLLNTYRASTETSSQQRGGQQFLNVSRSELRSFVAKKKRPPPPTTIMRLKAVRLYFAELDRAEHAANRTEYDERPPPRPGLVTTRKYSGRLQTGCVGGCFRL